MAVTICHASIDERGKINQGKAGDQTGREVCTRSWYNKPWKVMFRYKDANVAAKAAEVAKKLANSNLVGYDQYQRNTLYKALKNNNWDVDRYIKSGEKTETDCSAFVYACFCVFIPSLRSDSNAPTTSSMESVLTKHGFTAYKDTSFLNNDKNLKPGDLLDKPGSHIVMSIGYGDNAKPKPVENNNYVGKGIGSAVAKSNMQVRAGSSTQHNSYGIISKGSTVEVLEVLSNGWYKIAYPKAECGYAYTSNTQNRYYTYTPKAKPVTPSTATKKVSATNLPTSKSSSYDKSFTTTANLNIRNGAGTNHKVLVTAPKGTVVRCYGYYESQGSTKWLWVRFTLKGVQYTGYASKAYLR